MPIIISMSNDLVWISICIWLVGFWISSRYLPYYISLIVTTLKIAVPLFYFGMFFDEGWTLSDDLKYFLGGLELVRGGYTPLSVLFDPQQPLRAVAGGNHVLYFWWNLLGQHLFGTYYYAAVFLNIGLTFACGYWMHEIARLSNFDRFYARALALFFLLHWEIVAWSSLLNLKDIVVMTLTIMTFYAILKVSRQFTPWNVFLIAVSVYLLFWIRFYIPLVMVPATIAWFAINISWTSLDKATLQKYALLFLAILGGVAVVSFVGLDKIIKKQEEFIRPSLYGMFRMMLTPQPWSISPNYSFLLIPTILHWFMLIPAMYGAWLLWQESKHARLLLIYLLLALFLYGAYATQQGPRHRVQIIFIVVWLQFHFVWSLAQKPLRKQLLQRRYVSGLLLPRLSWNVLGRRLTG